MHRIQNPILDLYIATLELCICGFSPDRAILKTSAVHACIHTYSGSQWDVNVKVTLYWFLQAIAPLLNYLAVNLQTLGDHTFSEVFCL